MTFRLQAHITPQVLRQVVYPEQPRPLTPPESLAEPLQDAH